MEINNGEKTERNKRKYGGYNKGIDSARIWELPNTFCLDL